MRRTFTLLLPVISCVAGVATACGPDSSENCSASTPADVRTGTFIVTDAVSYDPKVGEAASPFELQGAGVEISDDHVRVSYMRDGTLRVVSYRVSSKSAPVKAAY